MEVKKVVIVTGAARGIGLAVALKFAENRFRVVLVDRSMPNLEQVESEIARKYQGESLICAGDLLRGDFLEEIIDQTVKKWGRIDVLVNNAAWRTIETMRTISRQTWENTLKVCLTVPAFLSRLSAAIMESQSIPGVIINVSSMMSDRPGGSSPAYIASKGAMESLTRELAVTYGRSGIRVLSVKPGYIDTDMSKDYVDNDGNNISEVLTEHLLDATPLARSGKPREVAEAVWWLSSDNAAFVTGSDILIDGGLKVNLNGYSLKHLQFPNEF